jgi:hypothetical protein
LQSDHLPNPELAKDAGIDIAQSGAVEDVPATITVGSGSRGGEMRPC